MVRIKTFGRDHIAARGLFNAVNQLEVHAHQAVSAGLDIISAVDRFNVDMPMKLSVRIGVDAGGPIIAGVLDLPLPAFEVFGELLAHVGSLSGIAPQTSVILTECVHEPILRGVRDQSGTGV